VQAATSTGEELGLPLDKILHDLNATQQGLTNGEAQRRLKTYGPNVLAREKKLSAPLRFLTYFKNPLVLLLLFAGIVSIFFGDAIEATIVFVIVIISVVLSFYQESKAEQAAELLREKVRTTASVLRESRFVEIPVAEVVPGDIIRLTPGDIVPADSKIIDSKDLFSDQSPLTGESFPVEKTTASDLQISTITERSDCVFMGTSIVSGNATAVVVATGAGTVYGGVAGRLIVREPPTDFDIGLRRFGYLIMQVTFVLVIVVFFVNALYKRSIVESLLFAVALAVGLTPELLPAIVTINLSHGAMVMSKRGVIVKRLSSIQNFGTMDVLCTDKTGTLTEDKIELIQALDAEGADDDNVFVQIYLNSYYETGLRSALDDACLRYRQIDIGSYSKIDEVPFDFTRKRVSVVYNHGGRYVLSTKGAPEEILKICTNYEVHGATQNLTDQVRGGITAKFRDLSSQGYRVLGVCYKQVDPARQVYKVADEARMTFLGLVSFLDPPKTTAKESLALLAQSKISLKILTGDNELVTKKVCEDLGLVVNRVVIGSDLVNIDDSALLKIVEDTSIFARVTPAQKERIMLLLKKNGHVVGFMGDGINDAPCIRAADVGISVENAVDVAKESADIILLQKDLTVLQQGVLEGRKTFSNTMKYVMMGTSSNFGNMFSAAGASLFLSFLPMLPEQILLNNLLYDVSEVTIPVDNVDPESVLTPRKWDMSFIKDFMIFFGPISSVFDYLTFAMMLFVFNAGPALFQTAWFLESLSTQALVVFVIRTRRPFYKSRPSKPLLISTLGVVAFALAIPFTPIGALFQFVIPPPTFLLALVAFIVAYLALVESLKGRFYRWVDRKHSQSPKRSLIALRGRPDLFSQSFTRSGWLRNKLEEPLASS